MIEFTKDKERKVRKLSKSPKKRAEDSSRFQSNLSSIKSEKSTTFTYDSFGWLATNYEQMYGLRNWTWQVIIDGIIDEHIKHNQYED
jgi:hypothetical protein